MFFDTHAHYDDQQFDMDREKLLKELPDKKVSLVVNPGSNLPSSRKAVEIASEYGYIYAAVGTHPHDAGSMRDGDLSEYETLCENEKVVAIGEIGLDYYYDICPRDVQRACFERQMELAGSLGLPVIVHDRDAHGDCLDIVKKFKNVTGVFHCYSGSLEMAKEIIRMGWYLSFTGAITFKNAKKAAEVIRWMPEDRIMIETDSPYLTPEPYRGRRNSSEYIHFVAEAVAFIRGMTAEEAAKLTFDNGIRFFGKIK